jgi:hypothetical protein
MELWVYIHDRLESDWLGDMDSYAPQLCFAGRKLKVGDFRRREIPALVCEGQKAQNGHSQ